MKTKITFLSILFAFQLNAQTLTYSTFATALTNTLNVVIANTNSFTTTLTTTTGTGVTWDASGLTQQTGIPTIHFIYGAPSGTPYASLFSDANYCQYDPALTSILDYEYYGINSDSLTKWGNYEPSAAHEIYQNPDKRLVFPFSYGQSFTDNYAKTNYSDATTVSSNQTGSRTVSFNGFGTLILPQGTFNNVGLISELRTNSLGPNSTTFTWWEINTGKQLMFYSENAGSVTVAYNIDLSTGINEINNNIGATVFPNPFSSNTTIKINSSTQLKNAVLKITDVLGKEIKSISVNTNEININRDEMESGIYFYQLYNNEKIISNGKIIIQ